MFNLSQNAKLRGSGFRVLNVIRAGNIITLFTNMAATWAIIAVTGMRGEFNFFETISHFFTFLINVFLLLTEVPVWGLRRYIARTWPAFGPDHSLFWLGTFQIGLGCGLLGSMSEPDFSENNLSMPVWSLVLAAGILSITFGVFSYISSLIFRDGANGITARMIRSDGNLATAKMDAADDYYSAASASLRQKEDNRVKRVTRFFKHVSHLGGSGKLKISKPIRQDQDEDVERGSDTWAQERSSPIVPEVQRPPTALHPALTGHTHYSVASNVNQF